MSEDNQVKFTDKEMRWIGKFMMAFFSFVAVGTVSLFLFGLETAYMVSLAGIAVMLCLGIPYFAFFVAEYDGATTPVSFRLPPIGRKGHDDDDGGGGRHDSDEDGGMGNKAERRVEQEIPVPAKKTETDGEEVKSPELKQKLQQISLKHAKARSPSVKSTYDPKSYQTDDTAFRGELPKRKRKGYDSK